MTNFFNKVKAMCSNASKQREITLAELQVQKAQEKLNALKGNVADNNKATNNNKATKNKKTHDVAYVTTHDDVKRYLIRDKFINKYDDVSSLVNFVTHNKYDDVIVNVAQSLIINVHELSNVRDVVKIYLRINKKNNSSELNDAEKSYLTHHLVVLYAMKHKAKQHNTLYAIKKSGTEETLLSYAKDRTSNIKDVYV